MGGSVGFDADPFDSGDTGGIHIEAGHPTLRLPPARCRRVLEHVIQAEGADLRHLTLVLSDHATVLVLNRRYLEHDYYTDVLAFDLANEEGVVDGEIYVDLDTADERCEEFGTDFEEEALRYAVHGLLHLVGYTDTTQEEKERMHELEDRYLREAL